MLRPILAAETEVFIKIYDADIARIGASVSELFLSLKDAALRSGDRPDSYE